MEYIKVPHQLIANANKAGCVREVLFYYQFKSVAPSHGVLSTKQAISKLTKLLNITHNGVRRLLNKCQFITCNGNKWIAIKYSNVWNALGIRTFKTRDCKNKRSINKLKCKLFRIHTKYCKNHQYLQAAICAQEVKLNQHQQLHSINTRRKLKTANITQLKIKQLSDPNKYILDQDASQYQYCIQGISDFVNYDINLSCKGTAQLLGYESVSKGYQLQQLMKKLGLACITQRIVTLRINSVINNAKVFKTSNGQLKARLCNAINIL